MVDTFTTAMKTSYSNLTAEVANRTSGDSSQIILKCVFSVFFICACATVEKSFHICQYMNIFLNKFFFWECKCMYMDVHNLEIYTMLNSSLTTLASTCGIMITNLNPDLVPHPLL